MVLRKRTVALVVLAVLIFAGLPTLPHIVRTTRLMLVLRDAARQQVDTSDIIQTEIKYGKGTAEHTARVYQVNVPGPRDAILFLPGLTPNGILNPRFVAVAQGLAKAGYVVVTPRLSGFDEFRLTDKAVQEVGFWYARLRGTPWFEVRKIGIVGVSVGGTIALLAAAREPGCSDVDFLVSIGGYQNLARCERQWFSIDRGQDRHGSFPVQYYGKWILMLMALDARPSTPDQQKLQLALLDLIARSKTSVSVDSLSPEAARWYSLAVGITDDKYVQDQIELELDRHYHALSAGGELAAIRCPVFLVHGVHDELIPPSETLALGQLLASTKTTTLFTPVISHTHPLLNKMSPWRRFQALAEAAIFLYRFVEAS